MAPHTNKARLRARAGIIEAAGVGLGEVTVFFAPGVGAIFHGEIISSVSRRVAHAMALATIGGDCAGGMVRSPTSALAGCGYVAA